MRRTVILRFGDAETNTVQEHCNTITQCGSVWWGWWKKDFERFPDEALQKLAATAAHGGAEIGLLNRKEPAEFYVAKCVSVRCDNAEIISSPEPDLTPEYYRAAKFPAWFKFTAIRNSDKFEFERLFGRVPEGTPTFYDVFDNGNEITVIPGPTWNMTAIETPGGTIPHLSDLHFGEYHGFSCDYSHVGADIDARPLWDLISTRIQRDLQVRVGVIVVSGDLISKGNGDRFGDAGEFLEKLTSSLELDKRHCVVVPGNHDLWTIGVENPTRTYGHENNYRNFVKAFFTVDITDLERVQRFRPPTGPDLVFVQLNSARLRKDDLRDYGFVGRHRYDAMLDFVTSTLDHERPQTDATVFAVLHHHLLPVNPVEIPEKNRPVSMCIDAGEITRACFKNAVCIRAWLQPCRRSRYNYGL